MNNRETEIVSRKTYFDWNGDTVCDWVPGNLDAMHVLNAMHIIFPEGERAFCRVMGSCLKHVKDPEVTAAVKGFITQEGAHAHAHHRAYLDLLERSPHISVTQAKVSRVLRVFLGSNQTKNRYLLRWRLAGVAAIEHLTTAIGVWTIEDAQLIERGCDYQISTMVKWHGAEEIEHRSVAFDAHDAIQKRFARSTRALAMMFWLPTLTLLWAVSANALLRNDTVYKKRRVLSVKAVRRAIAEGLIPNVPAIARGSLSFFKKSYHPVSQVSLETDRAARAWLESEAVRRYVRPVEKCDGEKLKLPSRQQV
jgi:predicted metal-dependent hydrolase